MGTNQVNQSAREIVTRVLTDVISNRKHLDTSLAIYLTTIDDVRTKSLVQEISYGVMRWYYQLDSILNLLISKPLKNKDTDLKVLLLSGIYQIKFLRTPDYATINESVETSKAIGKPWATKLINAILRRYQREQSEIEKKISDYDVSHFAFPAWLLNKIADQWPEHWQTILTASNQHPPMHLRLNTQIQSGESYLKLLKSNGINATLSTVSKTGILLNKAMNVEDIPGFIKGNISVQDTGAQLAAPLLDCLPGHRVLDACAAPGGKTGNLLERYPKMSELVAIDVDEKRVKLVTENLRRLNKRATIIKADIMDLNAWWDGMSFDRILLDAPCSASGIIRRHPDIKYLRTKEQIPMLLKTQKSLLETLWQVLNIRGKLLYCTCSIFKEECSEQIAQFINQYNNARLLPIDAYSGVNTNYGHQILPGMDESDGFFYSLLEKTES